MTKPLHAGRAAESGVIACDLVRYGWSSTDKILESPRGFFQAHGGGYNINSLKGKLGRPWTFKSPGISIKPHPCGSLTHPGMTKMLELIKKFDIKIDYLELRNTKNLKLTNKIKATKIFIAYYINNVRLIDNF